MTALDVADLVVIAAGVLGLGPDITLTRIDLSAADAALAEAVLPATLPTRVAAAAACTRLVHGLLRHPPFPGHSHQVAAAAGLQFLAINGWQADLDPRVAAVVVRSLDSGQLTPDVAAAWLMPRLSPLPAPLWEGRMHVLRHGRPAGAGWLGKYGHRARRLGGGAQPARTRTIALAARGQPRVRDHTNKRPPVGAPHRSSRRPRRAS